MDDTIPALQIRKTRRLQARIMFHPYLDTSKIWQGSSTRTTTAAVGVGVGCTHSSTTVS